MTPIPFPLKAPMKSPAVGDLQELLQQLLDRKFLVVGPDALLLELSKGLKLERAAQTFGPNTERLVSLFQTARRLTVSGEVDAPTAAALNRLGQKLAGPALALERLEGLTPKPLVVANPAAPKGKVVGELHQALQQVKLPISASDLARKELGGSTTQAVLAFQKSVGLPADGKLTPATVERLNVEVAHQFVAESRTRTRKVQEMLQRLGHKLDPAELKAGQFGPSTSAALKDFQGKAGLAADGRISNAAAGKLREAALAARLGSKAQVAQLHRTLLRALNIAKLKDVRVDEAELKSRQIGPSTQAALQAIQQKYDLPSTGQPDAITFDRLTALANSVPLPKKQLRPKPATELQPVQAAARLNMRGEHVGHLQQVLAHLGYPIDEQEYSQRAFGKTTQAAVLKFQRAHGQAETGHADKQTRVLINQAVKQANPKAETGKPAYHLRGSVRNEVWQGVAGARVEVRIAGQPALLAERRTRSNGFYDVPYPPQPGPVTLEVKALSAGNAELGSKRLVNPKPIDWLNFTQGDQPYRGTSEYTVRLAALQKAAPAGVPIASLSAAQVGRAAAEVGLSTDALLRLVLAQRLAAQLARPPLGPEACYAYLGQNLPPSLAQDLTEGPLDEPRLKELVETAATELVFLQDELQRSAFENAITLNLLPIVNGRQKEAVLAALAQLKQVYALDQPLLTGSGNLRGLLNLAGVPAPQHNAVAALFLQNGDLQADFWGALKANPAPFGGAAAVNTLENLVYLGQVTQNFTPLRDALHTKISQNQLGSPRDLAKLSPADWEDLIRADAGGQAPPGTPGGTPAERVQNYAAQLAGQSEQLFPAVALAAAVARSPQKPLQKVAEVQTQLLSRPDLDLRSANLDVFVREQGLVVAADVLADARVLQRVHRLAPTAAAGQALLELKLHNSFQIVAFGPEAFVTALTQGGRVEVPAARAIYTLAEAQYARMLQLVTEYRYDFQRATPAAIANQTFAVAAPPAELAGIPNLETLFGSLDFCDCPHCQSVYGPAAYLADLLRYLNSHLSELPNQRVKDILLARRPDLGNLLLNCQNTETPLPYIDLVCEVLENAVLAQTVPAPAAAPNYTFQTTRSPAELRAFPENVQTAAYDSVLKNADFPLDSAFNLWQEEARVFLQHLGVPRWQLMEQFNAPAGPGDAAIGGEYWGLSTHAVDLVTTPRATHADQLRYWGFKGAAMPAECSAAEWLRRSRLDYNQLLDLLQVRWLNPPAAADKTTLQRPNATCKTEEQVLTNLSLARWDLLHRFLRLWRHTGWSMWELDLLLRAPQVGGGRLDGPALAALWQFKRVQQRLGLDVEQALALYGDLNTEVRVNPADSKRKSQPLYANLFQNPAVIQPVDAAFTLPGNGTLSAHQSTLLAAFALSEADLARLQAKAPADNLNLANLSALARHVLLARGLGLRLADLLDLLDLTGSAEAFGTPKGTLAFIRQLDWVRQSGLEIGELKYLLTYAPDSPYGLRVEVITQSIAALREALRSSTVSQPDGVLITQVAAAVGLPPEQAQPLLAQLGADLPQALNLSGLMAQKDTEPRDFITPITPANFGALYAAYRLAHQAALLLSRQKVTTADLAWLIQKGPAVGLFNPAGLPAAAAPAAPLFPGWLALCQWLYFKGLHPEPEGQTLQAAWELAATPATPAAAVRAALAGLTQWPAAELDALAAGLGLQHGAHSDYAKTETLLRLEACFGQMKRLGVGAAVLLAWAKRDVDGGPAPAQTQAAVAQQIRQTAKAKYEYRAWLDALTPLEDALREKKRAALVSYLLENSQRRNEPEIGPAGHKHPNLAYWRNSNELLNYYLIDVEMSACQLTSRLKQAIGSTQMFVQRCLLGLERPEVEVSRAEQQDEYSENSWKQWKWMKNYRLWEANRKVFLYPENWIEPELRDDKSPFFKDLEAEIMQGDITEENAQAAFLHYLHKVHEVARLDIVGVYHEFEDPDPAAPQLLNTSLLHVVGRTRAHPALYYYRSFDLNTNEWSPWEKVEVDIQSEQVIPVVYNRRLYLFWLNFIEKPQKARKMPPAQPSSDTNVPENPNQLEITLGWTARRDGGWTAKRISRQKLIHPWQRPQYSYNLKSRYKERENQLWLDIHISQSPEFNNTDFWDPYQRQRLPLTKHSFSESAPPWHSSSFVFDGEVVNVKMKGLVGGYHMPQAGGLPSTNLVNTSSDAYVQANFGEEGRAIGRMDGRYEIAPRLPLPLGMHYANNRLANNRHNLNRSHANVLENGQTRTLLDNAQSPFEIVFSQHRIGFDTVQWGRVPFFYQDPYRAFFIRPEYRRLLAGQTQAKVPHRYTAYPFYHPYTALFLRELNRSGVDGLLNRRIQGAPQDFYPGNNFDFAGYTSPSGLAKADASAQTDQVDFQRSGAYAVYNWEIFFHAPLMIACKLSANQRFDEAMRWFHYIFDPTNTDSAAVPQRYWVTWPFFQQNSAEYRKQRIENLLQNIAEHRPEVMAWRNNPYKPHLIARFRPLAYQKAVVMKYIDNLIAWGDQLFRRDTIEAINEATTLYVLAYEMLGPRPVKVPNVEHQDLSYNQLTAQGGLDLFANQRVEILMENFAGTPVEVTRVRSGAEPLPHLDMFYFGIPVNDRLLDYWNTVEDRLFKIRHCMNLQGVVRQLPLFEPPIDPALLVKAAAAGVDLSSVLAELSAAPGPYRFQRLAQKAAELCGEVRALGDKLLGALEKSDAEGLALLRSTQEMELQRAVRQVRKRQIDEANETWAGLEQNRLLAGKKKEYYSSREFMNPLEIVSAGLSGGAIVVSGVLAASEVLAAVFALLPNFNLGVSGAGGSPQVTAQWGFENVTRSLQAATGAIQHVGSILSQSSSLVGSMAGHQRRKEEWDFQADLATSEIAQLDRQIAAAQVRLAIAEKELENHELQMEHAQTTDEYMRSKYTHQQLYDWQIRQVAGLYFQSYQLAYDLAKRAEKSFQLEIGDRGASFVQFGYWDSLKKGLLAGERLAADLHRMEAAYLERNTRDLELTRHISLAQVAPLSLLQLKQGGSCQVELPEWFFDLDYPGHYRRRLKTVSISIPCVVGPYTSINCTLSLTDSRIRGDVRLSAAADPYGDPWLDPNDDRFYKVEAPLTAIATSHAQNDSGMFELSFNDERFLPFEGAGAVSRWTLTLPQSDNQFDLATLSDVILHLRYTASAAGAGAFQTAARQRAQAQLPQQGWALLNLPRDFGSAWQRFLHPDPGADQTLSFQLGPEHLPFFARSRKKLTLAEVNLLADSPHAGSFDVQLRAPGAAAAVDGLLEPKLQYGSHQHLLLANFANTVTPSGVWELKLKKSPPPATDFQSLTAEDIRNLYLVVKFTATA